jgi:uncharacterized integral membrane protein (TIGR00697 family)
MKTRKDKLFLLLGAFFITNALLAEFVGVKIFSLEKTLGVTPFTLDLFGQTIAGFNLTAGVMLWPIVFLLTDLINEYYGRDGVRRLSFIAAGMILYAFIMVSITMALSPADFWAIDANTGFDVHAAYNKIFGQGLWIIAGSLTAFLVGQFVDVAVFIQLRRLTQSRFLWLRATGSTLVSQLIDSYVVLFIAFYWGAGWSAESVLAIGMVNYIYKFVIAISLTPVLYSVHWLIDRYLGIETQV